LPYYAQAKGQAEASNKILIGLIKEEDRRPRRWLEVLSDALWAYRVSKHDTIKVSPFELVYRQEAMLPIEINLQTYRELHQGDLTVGEYKDFMLDRIDDIPENRLDALREIEREVESSKGL
jgi:hypothetical protein